MTLGGPAPGRRGRTRGWVVLVAALLAAGGCGGGNDGEGGDSALRPALDQVAPALAAVEAELGGSQQYFEVNATPQVVNIFVAADRATMAVPYVYVGGELGSPADAQSAVGETFAADALTFDPATVLDGVTEDLPDADIVRFTVLGGPGGAVQYSALVQSSEGGTLEVVLGPDGAVQSVDPAG